MQTIQLPKSKYYEGSKMLFCNETAQVNINFGLLELLFVIDLMITKITQKSKNLCNSCVDFNIKD